MLRKKMSGVAKGPRLSSALQEQAPGTVDRRAFLRNSGLAIGGLAAVSAIAGGRVREARGRGAHRRRQDRHQEVRVHALLGRLHHHGRGAERRVDRPGAGLRLAPQPRRPLRQGRGRARACARRPPAQVSDEARRGQMDPHQLGCRHQRDRRQDARHSPEVGPGLRLLPGLRQVLQRAGRTCSASSTPSGAPTTATIRRASATPRPSRASRTRGATAP